MSNDKFESSDALDDKLIEQCQNVDFSIESMNREKNLEMLKTKFFAMSQKQEGRGVVSMNKRIKKPLGAAVAIVAVLCFSVAAFGQDIIRIIQRAAIGEYAQYFVIEDIGAPVPLPAEYVGQLFDEAGEALTHYPRNGRLFNADGEEMRIYADGDNVVTGTVVEYEMAANYPTVSFEDMAEGIGYFATHALLPAYLPAGYAFHRVEFFAGSVEEISSDPEIAKYMHIYYSDGEDTIYLQVRFMDGTSAFETGVSGDAGLREMDINGHDAVMLAEDTLHILVDDVMYMFIIMPDGKLSADELIKMAASLQ